MAGEAKVLQAGNTELNYTVDDVLGLLGKATADNAALVKLVIKKNQQLEALAAQLIKAQAEKPEDSPAQ